MNAFDNDLYLKIQREKIIERIKKFNGKLYLEFGGKLFDDYHASRVLRGFEIDSKLKVLMSLKDQAEIIITINSNDIDNMKIRGDNGITYQSEVERLIDVYKDCGLDVAGVVFSFYHPSNQIKQFMTKLKKNDIKVYKHYEIKGYPNDLDTVLSSEGLGKNEYVETTKPLVILTAPGPGSGKMAVCLSQIYLDSLKGITSGYAKYETFPVWNLPLNHPVNVAYEAATVDLKDVNMIDPYHLEKYGEIAINYNRDVETFPLLKAIFEKIYGQSPYNSPTDMGVNMVGYAIINDDIAKEDSKQEVIRRYFSALKYNYLGKYSDEEVEKLRHLMNLLNINIYDRKCVVGCLEKYRESKKVISCIELADGKIITGKRSEFFSSSGAMLLNAVKYLANIDDSIDLISNSIVEPLKKLKMETMNYNSYRLHVDEILIALAIQQEKDELSKLAFQQLNKFKNAQMHSSIILSEQERFSLKKLGINVTEEPITYAKKLYNA